MRTTKETETPEFVDMSKMVRAIQEQTAAIERLFSLLQTDLAEIKHILSLTPVYPMRYYFSQENFGGQMQGVVHGKNSNVLKSTPRTKPRPPFVPKGESVTCVRCQYEWTPQSRTPQKCPSCRSPWWYEAKYRWRKKSQAANEVSEGTTETGKEQG